MTKEEYKDRYTVLSRQDIRKALVEEGLAAADGKNESLDLFLDYIGLPKEGTVAYCRDGVADAKDWILKWDDIFWGFYGDAGDPGKSLTGYLEDMHGLSFREDCASADELDDGQWFCEKVTDGNGQTEIRRYWARCGSDTFPDLPAGELCSWLMLNGHVFDDYDWRFSLLERFLDVNEILKQVMEEC